jgi:hypothetical protein
MKKTKTDMIAASLRQWVHTLKLYRKRELLLLIIIIIIIPTTSATIITSINKNSQHIKLKLQQALVGLAPLPRQIVTFTIMKMKMIPGMYK